MAAVFPGNTQEEASERRDQTVWTQGGEQQLRAPFNIHVTSGSLNLGNLLGLLPIIEAAERQQQAGGKGLRPTNTSDDLNTITDILSISTTTITSVTSTPTNNKH
ncbi:unnamed protein product [Boreogadus saida]